MPRVFPRTLLVATSIFAFCILPATPVKADECLLDINENGVADEADTTGGADSEGVDERLACGVGANAVGPGSTAIGFEANASGANGGNVALGNRADASGTSGLNTALGTSSQVTGNVEGGVAVGFDSRVLDANYGIAIGYNAVTSGANGVAIGRGGLASGDGSLALGGDTSADPDTIGARALGVGALAIGTDSLAQENGSTAIGVSASSTGLNALAIGQNASATAAGAIALGDGASVTHSGSVALGANSATSGTDEVSVGRPESIEGAGDAVRRRLTNVSAGTATSDAATVGQLNGLESALRSDIASNTSAISMLGGRLGTVETDIQAIQSSSSANNLAIERNNGAIGTLQTATQAHTAKLGFVAVNVGGNASGSAMANADAATALGANARATGTESLALGANASATGLRATAFGFGASATSLQATAAGTGSSAAGIGSLAFGSFASSQSKFTTALGYSSIAIGDQATAVGTYANAAGPNATAVGRGAEARSKSGTAIGHNAAANFTASTAVGTGATTTAINQVKLGGTGSHVVIADIEASTDAQQGPVDIVTIDAKGTLGRQRVATAAQVENVRMGMDHIAAVSDAQFSALDGRVTSLELGFANIGFRLDQLEKDYRSGVAAAMAQADAPMPSAPGRTSYTGKGSVYRGETAFSLGLTHRLDTESPFALMASVSHSGGDNTGGTIGFTGEF